MTRDPLKIELEGCRFCLCNVVRWMGTQPRCALCGANSISGEHDPQHERYARPIVARERRSFIIGETIRIKLRGAPLLARDWRES